MAVAVVQDWPEDETDRSTTNYDASAGTGRATRPPGCSSIPPGSPATGFRIYEVWESRGDFDRFVEERLMPIVGEIAGPDARQPDLTVHERHNFQAAPQ